MIDPVDLTRRLIRCPSVTPEDAGAIDTVAEVLAAAGFVCTRCDRGGIANLYARWGTSGPVFGFNGHTDVVPAGDADAWTHDPFGGEIADGLLHGRGATDMKSGVAAFAAAAVRFVTETPPAGSVVLAITGDEEGPSVDGTRAILDWMAAAGERLDACLVGEPTCPETFGEMIKIGRRGSLTARIEARGVQGHAAYPHRARNPVSAMARLTARLSDHALDQGTDAFDPSTLALTAIDTGNPASNVIPAACRATVNIRFNDAHSSETLSAWLREMAERVAAETGIAFDMAIKVSGESFLTPPGPLSDLVSRAVAAETGVTPVLSTSGGTSDARFIRDHCPVVEFGLVGRTMHQVDECVPVDQIVALERVYRRILSDFFA
ncbi:succinyl-diaminopimelate desuccinylase [Rhodobacteraceae bacterium CCMM004]|nr:succinyl-diaminopimelate desuccinylase [Rhodobacteraceae bacterium CCMM004]